MVETYSYLQQGIEHIHTAAILFLGNAQGGKESPNKAIANVGVS